MGSTIFLSFLKSLATNGNARNATWDAILNEGKGYVDATFCVQDPVCRYNQGKLTFDIMTMFVGYAEVKGALTSGLKANGFAKVVLQMNKFDDLVKSVSSAVTGFGGSIVKTATKGVADVFTSTGQKMATITADLFSPLPAHWTTNSAASFKRFVGTVKVKDPVSNQVADEMMELVEEGGQLKFRIRKGLLQFSISSHFLNGLKGISMPTSTNVSFREALKFTPTQPDLVDLAQLAVRKPTDEESAKAIEKIATKLFHQQGFEPISINPKNGGSEVMKYIDGQDKGFDEIAFSPPIDLTKPLNQITINEIIVIEAKTMNKAITLGTIKNPNGPGLVNQISDEWIRKTAGELILSRDPIKEKLGTIIIDQLDNNRTKLYKAIVAVNKENADVVVQKIID